MSWQEVLLEDPPLVVRPKLAVLVGLNEAIVLQQLHFTLTHLDSKAVEIEGVRWCKAPLTYWCERFPFMSEATIKRAFQSLRNEGLVATERGRESNAYTIHYENVALLADQSDPPHSSDCADETDQSDPSSCIGEGTTRGTTSGDDAAAPSADLPDALPGLEPPPTQPKGGAEISDKAQRVWDHYFATFGDKLRVKTLTPPRLRTINKALKAVAAEDDAEDRSVETCCAAIDGLKSYRAKFPDRSQDTGLDVIFSTGPQDRSNLTEKIEWWASQGGDRTALPSSVPSAMRARVIDLAVQVLTVERRPDDEAVRERGEQALAELMGKHNLRPKTDGAGKLVSWEIVPEEVAR